MGIALHLAASITAQAHLIYSFQGAKGNEPEFPPDAQPAHAVATPMSRGPGLIPDTSDNALNAHGWTTAAEPDPSDYYRFAIAPKPDYQLTLTTLKVDERSAWTGVTQWSVRSSLDGFASDLAVFSVPSSGYRFKQTIELGETFRNLNGPVEFRIYGFSARSAGGAWRLVYVELDGYVIAARPTLHMDRSGTIRWRGLAGYPYVIQTRTAHSDWSSIGTNLSSEVDKQFEVPVEGLPRWFRILCPEHRQHIDP